MDKHEEIAFPHISDNVEKFQSPYVNFRSGISAGERIAVKNREKKALEALKKFNINAKKVPVVSLLVSGGGLRAAIACQGVLTELSSLGLLDLVTYIAGVSGSTWCMASLFSKKDGWQDLQKSEDKLRWRLLNVSYDRSIAWPYLLKLSEREDFSMTDIWDCLKVYSYTKELPAGHLSSVKDQCQKGIVPYPIFAAVDLKLMSDRTKGTHKAWFEFTPDECGYPTPDFSKPEHHGAFVSTAYYGSHIERGRLVKKNDEREFSYLRALCGSAPFDMKTNVIFLKDKIWEYFSDLFTKAEMLSEEPLGVLLKHCMGELWNLIYAFVLHEDCVPKLKELHDALAENEIFPDVATLINQKIPKWHKISQEQQLQFIQDLLSKMFREDLLENRSYWSYIIFPYKLMQNLLTWTWGTTRNFVYKYDLLRDKLFSNREYMYLGDAGVAINTAYPLVLPPVRNSDIIISFDFSEGDQFLTITATEKYCKAGGFPFPPVDKDKLNKEAKFPSGLYIFEGERSPVIMHIPLFNKVNCFDKGVYDGLWSAYSTFRYSDFTEGEIYDLLELAKKNVRNNKDSILAKIRALAETTV